MCGIVGIISKKSFNVKDSLIGSLRRLEYRGYDSAGFATLEGGMVKAVGHIYELEAKTDSSLSTSMGVAHTRWATHGEVTEANCHPHCNSSGTIFAVHNGIIENFQKMRKELASQGYEFVTETDSEIIPHFLDSRLRKGVQMKQAVMDFMAAAEGTFAILAFESGKKVIYALKRDSPLAVGLARDRTILGSDIYAFASETKNAVFLDDNEFAEITEDACSFFNAKGSRISKEVKEFDVKVEAESKKEHRHYMIKEILEQPLTSQRLIDSFGIFQKDKVDDLVALIKKAKRVMFLSCGTSYHASLVGVWLLSRVGVRAHAVIASEFENYLLADKDTLVIAITQSGETMDVVSVLKDIRDKGIKIASLINVPYSTVQRLSDVSIEILAGQEVCVASTKAFTNQLIALMHIANRLGYRAELSSVPQKIARTIEENTGMARVLAKELHRHKDIFVLGKSASYPLAREIALKLKELAYIHAEGMMAGELKHGTIALIEKGTPVLSLIPNSNPDMISSTKEVEARGARITVISNHPDKGHLHVPESCDAEFAVYSGIVGHLLSYYIADLLGRPIDKPRNLAKSVTVK